MYVIYCCFISFIVILRDRNIKAAESEVLNDYTSKFSVACVKEEKVKDEQLRELNVHEEMRFRMNR